MDAKTFRVFTGPVNISSAVLDVKFDMICFTGSTLVGKLVYQAAAKHLTPVILELGGKSPVYVHRDAALEQAVTRITWGKFMNAGQTCVAPDYILVDEAVKPRFLDLMKKQIKQFYGDDPTKSKDLERVVSDRHVTRLSALLKGQNVFFGGRIEEKTRHIEPTILLDPSPESPVMQEEIFGPILPVLTVKTPEEAIRFINARPKPLSLYVFTQTSSLQQKFMRETSAGGCCVNDVFMHTVTNSLPFGGVGDSGMGAYHGKHSFESFSHLKPILYAPTLPDPPFRFPPYTEQALKLTKLFMFTLTMQKVRRGLGVVGISFLTLIAYVLYSRYFK
jgi:aldehyde dehydrogenase (NAD+)